MHNDDRLLIIAPSSFEFAVVRKGLGSLLMERKCRLMMCGVGEKQSRAFSLKLDPVSISRLVLVGWGGGLTAALKAGDILCADKVLHADLPALACAPSPGGRMRTGPILTSRKALLTSTEKQAAAATGAIAVEMEAYPLAAWASQHSIPFIHGRVILDAWNESLPDLGQGLDDSGRIQRLPLLKLLAARPALLIDLMRLNHRIKMVNPLLATLAVDLVRN